LIWPITATCPPIKQFSPTLVEPATPDWAAITVFLPISTLWAIWIRLSNLTPLRIIVEPKVALSIVVAEPISTLSSIITLPICGIFCCSPFSSGKKPKPSAPIIAPELILQFFPITDSEYTLTPANNVVLSSIVTLSPI